MDTLKSIDKYSVITNYEGFEENRSAASMNEIKPYVIQILRLGVHPQNKKRLTGITVYERTETAVVELKESEIEAIKAWFL
jgi:hypothetical protein